MEWMEFKGGPIDLWEIFRLLLCQLLGQFYIVLLLQGSCGWHTPQTVWYYGNTPIQTWKAWDTSQPCGPCASAIVSLPPSILIFPKSNRSNSSTLVLRSHGICAISGSCPAITQRPPTFCRVPLELVALQAEEPSPSIISGESSLLPWNSPGFWSHHFMSKDNANGVYIYIIYI